MTANEFRQVALSFPGTSEIDPHGAPEFLVRTRCFASLGGYPVGERAAVKLTPAEQAAYMAAEPNVFFLGKGARGRRAGRSWSWPRRSPRRYGWLSLRRGEMPPPSNCCANTTASDKALWDPG